MTMVRRKIWGMLFSMGVKTPIAAIIIIITMIVTLFLLVNSVYINVYVKFTGDLIKDVVYVKVNPQINSNFSEEAIWYSDHNAQRYKGTIVHDYYDEKDRRLEVKIWDIDLNGSQDNQGDDVSIITVEVLAGRERLLDKILNRGDRSWEGN
jgi:hypothetical protein